jgi:hypothetical protein
MRKGLEDKEKIRKQLENMTVRRNGCWLHTGKKDSKGFIQVCVGGRGKTNE